jgi:DNA replication initiation complex subunit (GINS family)
MDITDEEKRFIEKLVQRIPSTPNASIKTRSGKLVVTQAEKARLDKIARREGIGDAANLIRFYLPPN